ncbi:ATP-dependent DNA helicase, partial [Loktanella sp. DJP18]|uniref:ATP-dependent DNA helicase n=1 Tax=Loktanella sp. DJP18 TaxID=3409788 RepID=UPI003BB704FD
LRKERQSVQASARFELDLDYENQTGVREVLAAVRSGAPVVFVSGRAGTGKSRLIDYMKRIPGGEKQVVVAPTGVAALALKASTVHSFFRLPIGVIDVTAMEPDERFGPVHRRMQRLVIDEISMVRADILDGIDRRLRLLRNPDLPFGGVQVIMVGDFLQLPPVVTEEDRNLLDRLGYETPFAFSAKVMQSTPIRVATLTKVWRQSDPEMIAALGNIREGRCVDDAVHWLNQRCARDHRSGFAPLLLTATRSAADAYNEDGIGKLRDRYADLEGECIVLHARAGGAFEKEKTVLPAPRRLELYRGARVMAVKNDAAQGYVNGSLGEVVDFCDGSGVFEDAWVAVLFDGNETAIRLFAANWLKSSQKWDDTDEAIVDTPTGIYEQVPLTVGYAITIHKSQGLTLEDVRLDLGRGAFAPGQLYVALSRAKSVAGLSFARPILPSDVQVDDMLIRFLDWAKSADNLAFGDS